MRTIFLRPKRCGQGTETEIPHLDDDFSDEKGREDRLQDFPGLTVVVSFPVQAPEV